MKRLVIRVVAVRNVPLNGDGDIYIVYNGTTRRDRVTGEKKKKKKKTKKNQKLSNVITIGARLKNEN
jgi:pyruvate carboxylase